ncbi:PREDICTED: poly(U)-specific endoribonuclease homolog [Dufourea novaeangliae]|uniref:poly(U)-specific endoribonuclease homolog n=1 Tax=Dufourea novaeangliae TaxID=178035 RepID=UPI0007672B14|nr:PREDICTED: poly(U)-specific endoribonuclease homolog [Dufourea novaeangliae]
MKSRSLTLFITLLAVSLIVDDTEAGWKFWKKKDKDTTTTTTTTVAPSSVAPTTSKPPNSPTNLGSAVIGAGDPGLAIGVNSNGQNIRNNAKPNKPNPGTEVGLDIAVPKPGKPGTGGTGGQGYRDWAADLTGAGEPGRPQPKLPNQGPALSPGATRPASLPGTTPRPQPAGPKPVSTPRATPGQPQSPGVRPGPAPGNNPAPRPLTLPQEPSQPQTPGSRPSSVPGSPSSLSPPGTPTSGPGQVRPAANQLGTGGNQVSTLYVGSLNPSSTTPPPSRPGSPGSPGKTWADVAGGGSRPNSPTPSPRQPGYPNQPGYPSQPGQAQPRPQTPAQPGRTRPSTGAIAGGALAGGALAGAAAAGAASSANKAYSSNPTYSKGNTITDEDLEKLAEALFIKDNNNANRHITLNLQKQTSSSSTTDDAPQPLFTVNTEAFQGPTIQRVISIYDNYQPDTNVNEHISPLQRQEESLLVDTFLSTNVMSAAMRFLADKGQIRKDYYDYKENLRKIWFNLFSRGQGKIGSSGFEHVFMAELKNAATGTEVVGLHNWIFYSKEEASGKADYNGYLKKVDLGDKASIVKIRTKYSGQDKPVTTIFVGTSPELEMALYTVCFYARPDGNCPVSLGGTKFNIVTYKFRYRGNDLVGTAYPDI